MPPRPPVNREKPSPCRAVHWEYDFRCADAGGILCADILPAARIVYRYTHCHHGLGNENVSCAVLPKLREKIKGILITGDLMKRITAIILCALIVFSFSGCKYWIGKRPSDQPLTSWVSEDGNIFFSIDEMGGGHGTMCVNGEKIEIYVAFGPTVETDILLADQVDDEGIHWPPLERWVGDYIFEDRFIVEVSESTYFQVGDKIRFDRVDYTEAAHDE